MGRIRQCPTGALVALLAFVGATTLHAQLNPTGRINGHGWLILGPFSNPFGCSMNHTDLLGNHLAPSSIAALMPVEGDEVDYDPFQAVSTAYSGPLENGKPVWRHFDDGTADEDLDFEEDAVNIGGLVEDVVSFAVTYFEYFGPSAANVDLCVGSDDGVQVWIDGAVVHNLSACRPRGECQDVVPVTIEPGVHRIAMGIWERAGGWGGSLGFRKDGRYITDADPGWAFLGIDREGSIRLDPSLLIRSVASPSDPAACPPRTGGPVTVGIKAHVAEGPAIGSIRETASGSFGPDRVSASNGGVVTLKPQPPLRPAGVFADSRIIGTYPRCAGGNGEIEYDDGGTSGDFSDDVYTLSSTGVGIWSQGEGDSDTFTFVYNKVQGDFSFTARIANRSWVPGSQWGQIGLMARQDVTIASRFSMTADSGEASGSPTSFWGRPTHGGNDNFLVNLPNGTHHDWLRLKREGDTFIGDSSPDFDLDGSPDGFVELGRMTWTSAPAALLVGLAVSSFTGECAIDVTEGTFDSVSLEPTGSIVPYTVPDPAGVEITWTDVPRSIAAAGLGYTIDIDGGAASFRGTAGGTPILGPSSARVLTGITEHGPVAALGLPYAHAIGAECPGIGVAEPSPGAVAIAGAGTDIWAGGDQFLFAYREVTGDFSARVTIRDRQFAPDSRWGKHGIMARQDCSPRSRYSFVHDQQDSDAARMANRPTHGGIDNFDLIPAVVPPDIHANTLRLDRCGNEFIAYVLDEVGSFGGDPGDWIEIGRHEWAVNPPPSVHLGLAVTSGKLCEITTITFEDWEVLERCDGPVEDLACTVNQSGGLDLSWTNPAGANTQVPISIEVNGIEITTVPGDATSAFLGADKFPEDQISRIDVINSSTIASTCSHPPEYSPSGFIKNWLILGPFGSLGGAAPGPVEIAYDYLTDGVTTEANIEPAAGLQVMPDYYDPADGSGLAASTGLVATPNRPDLNPGGVPTWFEHRNRSGTIDFNYDIFKSDLNSVMCYAAAYLTVAEDTTVDLGIGSDDSVEVLIDGIQVHLNNTARSYRPLDTVQDIVTGVTLAAGCHLILVKVFDGTGEHGFRLRLQDAAGSPVLAERVGFDCAAGGGFRRGDSDANGDVNLTDAIRILNVLFLGIGTIPCDDAADADDNGAVNLTDAIRILNVLFLGLGTIGPPGAGDCGPDPTGDGIDCAAYGADC